MKKITALLLSLAMITSLSACGEKKEETASTTEATTVTTKATTKATTKETVPETTENLYELNKTVTFNNCISIKVNSNWYIQEKENAITIQISENSGIVIAKQENNGAKFTESELIWYFEEQKSQNEIDDYSFTEIDNHNTVYFKQDDIINYYFILNGNMYALAFSDALNENLINSVLNSIHISEQETEEMTEEKEDEDVSLGMKNALSKAKNYLDTMPFSYEGLVEQLEFEGYTNEEAVYGADNCGADWNEQAAKKAQDYLDTMEFSRQGLIDQLIYEGFTEEQAEYGVTAVGY